ncbi:MAG: TIGR03915 family putative DNA repair protein [Treponema sp.]|nr:TIGR03915 family putative DNA repair protein [Treponema sp.]
MDSAQGDLFEDAGNGGKDFSGADIAVIAALHANTGVDLSLLPPQSRRLYELSINAFCAITHAGMSELPITAAIARFEHKVLAAADAVTNASGPLTRGELEAAQRQTADAAAADRGDSDVCTVLEAAYKVWHEIHRLMGLLRFCPNEDGVYIARCEPDHFVIPALGPHFRERFGETPWAIIDEKRRLCLRYAPSESRVAGELFEFFNIDKNPAFLKNPPDSEWGNLWRLYHKTINNESRNNPGLQRRFMPARYWKYLNEVH